MQKNQEIQDLITSLKNLKKNMIQDVFGQVNNEQNEYKLVCTDRCLDEKLLFWSNILINCPKFKNKLGSYRLLLEQTDKVVAIPTNEHVVLNLKLLIRYLEYYAEYCLLISSAILGEQHKLNIYGNSNSFDEYLVYLLEHYKFKYLIKNYSIHPQLEISKDNHFFVYDFETFEQKAEILFFFDNDLNYEEYSYIPYLIKERTYRKLMKNIPKHTRKRENIRKEITKYNQNIENKKIQTILDQKINVLSLVDEIYKYHSKKTYIIKTCLCNKQFFTCDNRRKLCYCCSPYKDKERNKKAVERHRRKNK